MITGFILGLLATFLTFLIGLLPASEGLPAGVTSALTTVLSAMQVFSAVIAIDTLLQIVVLMTVYYFALFAWDIVQWIIKKIPGMH